MEIKFFLKCFAVLSFLLLILNPVSAQGIINAETNANGSIKKWHRIELELTGPNLTEASATFRNYRLDVTFTSPTNKVYKVPGFFDGDGDPANTGATSGDIWKARFVAGEEGTWTYTVSFVTGTNVAANLSGGSGGTLPDGQSGSFVVGTQDKSGKDFRAKGKLEYVGEHYLQFANGEYFIKAGANSPEVFLADEEFDGGVGNVDHSSQMSSWNSGDPTWGDNKGKGIIGVVNYLSNLGVNSHYFLTMNILGDGKRSYPYVNDESPYTFDISKLGQWEIVFSQFDKMGLMLHFVTTETENTQYFENQEGGFNSTQFAIARKIYYRELVARFGHHLAITWNVGEENNYSAGQTPNTISQRKAFAERFRALTYYEDNITIHNGETGQSTAIDLYEEGDLLGDSSFTGTSLQLKFSDNNHDNVRYWYDKSAASGKKWVIAFDEPWSSNTFNIETLRKRVLWSTLLAGGQVEWYHSGGGTGDLSSSRDYSDLEDQWRTIGIAANFMNQNFSTDIHRMIPNDALISNNNYAMADLGNTYLFYLIDGGNATVDLSSNSGSLFSVLWFDPNTGASFADSSVYGGSSSTNLGAPPSNTSSDWVILVKKVGTGGNVPPAVSFSLPESDANFPGPDFPAVTVSASDSDGTVESVELFLNDVSIGQDINSPYNWNDDSQLPILTEGTYTLRALATDNDSDTSSVERTFTIGDSNDNDPPSVSFVLPTSVSTFSAPASITVNVSASDSDGSISFVDLYLNDILVRRENSGPYDWNDDNQDDLLSGLSNGTYILKAVATDNDGDTSSVERTFVVETDVSNTNFPPSVSFNLPATNSSFIAPAAVMVNVSASDTDGTISSVDLYLNDVLVRRENSGPYDWNGIGQNDSSLQNLSIGTYRLKAVATDNDGDTSSVEQIFTVETSVSNTNVPPTVSFNLPVSMSAFTVPASVVVNVSASDSDGSVSSVDLYLNNDLVRRENNSPYDWNGSGQNDLSLQNLSNGTYTLKAIATDNDGANSIVETTFTVQTDVIDNNVPPTVSFNLPANLSTYTEPAKVVVNVSASDIDGSVSSVDLYLNNVLVRRENISPYDWNDDDQDSQLSNLSNGTYILKAVATDNDGGSTSVVRTFTVEEIDDNQSSSGNQPPIVSFTLPANTSAYTEPASVVVNVAANDLDGSISYIDLYLDDVFVRRESISSYDWNAIGQNDPSLKNLSAGSYTLKAIAADNDGATASTSRVFTVLD